MNSRLFLSTISLILIASLAFGQSSSPIGGKGRCQDGAFPGFTNIEYESADRLRFEWSGLSGTSMYQVRARKLNTPVVEIDELVTGTSFTTEDLDQDNLYIWQVRAYCNSGEITGLSAKDTFGVAASPFYCGGVVVDYRDGRHYRTVLKGDQCWMRDNAYLQFPAGTYGYSEGEGCNAPAKVGAFYGWTTAKQIDSMYTHFPWAESGEQGICPVGWRVPTTEDYDELFSDSTITVESIQPDGGSGLDLRFGGYMNTNGVFIGVEEATILLSSSEASPGRMYAYLVDGKFSMTIDKGEIVKDCRGTVRCMRDARTGGHE